MSGAMESRAAVFAQSPQDVEVYQQGAWWPGALLGWRHDDSGACQVWVRVSLAGVEETAWTDLVALRLPQPTPDRMLAAAVGRPSEGPVTREVRVPRGLLAGPEADVSPVDTQTRGLPRVQEGSVVADRRRPWVPTGGRRRAPETHQTRPAPSAAVAPAGRHRASGVPTPGRHRMADTDMLPAVALSPESDLLTRPMRLSHLAPASRRPRLDGFLSNA